jgi:hypothetical protein
VRAYEIDEATIQLPDEWADQSVNILASSREMPAEFSLVINRDGMEDGEELSDYVARQEKSLRQELPGLSVTRRGDLPIDGRPAVDLELRWTADTGPVRQRQICVAHEPGKVLTLTATAKEPYYAKYQATLDDIVARMRFRRRG